MTANPFSVEVSARICRHMNTDHVDAVNAYAHHYGGVTNPSQAEMVAVTPLGMELEVDGKSVFVAFDHTLLDSKDAHKTLVAMLEAIPKKLESPASLNSAKTPKARNDIP